MEEEKPKPTSPTSMRLSAEGKRLQKEIAAKLGISQKAVMELAIRELAKKQHVK